MKKLLSIFFYLCILSECTAACSNKVISSSSDTANQISTVAPSNTPEPPHTSTPTPLPTFTLQPTLTDTPTITPSPMETTPVCINQAEFVRHLSVSENTVLQVGTYFAKVWRIKNTGTCVWGTDYQFVFESGDAMSSPAETTLPKQIHPGETVDIQVVLITPMEPRTYAGNWMLRDPSGRTFGSGKDGNQPFSAIVVVEGIQYNERRETYACG